MNHLMPQTATPQWPAAPTIEIATVDMDAVLTLAQIREYTKTDDVPSVTDEQLKLLRQASFEVAEKYLGWLFTSEKAITEDVAFPRGRKWRDYYTHRLRYPSADGIVHLYGAVRGLGNRTLHITPQTRNVKIPVLSGAFDVSNCCDPCSTGKDVNYGMKVLYRAGVGCENGVPAGVLLGCLKLIAWYISNPGDEILTVRNKTSGQQAGIIGTNNAAWASGAIEQWRIFSDDAA